MDIVTRSTRKRSPFQKQNTMKGKSFTKEAKYTECIELALQPDGNPRKSSSLAIHQHQLTLEEIKQYWWLMEEEDQCLNSTLY